MPCPSWHDRDTKKSMIDLDTVGHQFEPSGSGELRPGRLNVTSRLPPRFFCIFYADHDNFEEVAVFLWSNKEIRIIYSGDLESELRSESVRVRHWASGFKFRARDPATVMRPGTVRPRPGGQRPNPVGGRPGAKEFKPGLTTWPGSGPGAKEFKPFESPGQRPGPTNSSLRLQNKSQQAKP